MGLDDVVRALRARLALIGVLVLVGTAVAAGLAALKTPTYRATAQINISGPAANANDITGQAAAVAKVPTFIEILPSQGYLQKKITELGLKTTWQDLQDRVEVINPAGTSLLDVAVTDTSAARAAAVANALADGFDDHLEDIGQGTVRSALIARADQPDSPSSPVLFLWLAIGGVVGLALGTSAAIVRAARDRSLHTPVELREHFGLPVLGVVPFDPDARKQPLPVADPGSGPRAEALRQLRTNLQFLHVAEGAEPPRSLLVTSAVGGEGKTSTACNLAIALAQAGLSTILVGADLRRPDVQGTMGLTGEAGLTSVLAGWTSLDDALRAWGDESDSLFVLGAGPVPPNPSELLASEQMQDLLRLLEKRADIVIVDGAPLLPVADSAALAAIVDGTLLAVAADRTQRDQVERALGILQGVDAHVHGVVLTMARSGVTASEARGYLEPQDRPR